MESGRTLAVMEGRLVLYLACRHHNILLCKNFGSFDVALTLLLFTIALIIRVGTLKTLELTRP